MKTLIFVPDVLPSEDRSGMVEGIPQRPTCSGHEKVLANPADIRFPNNTSP